MEEKKSDFEMGGGSLCRDEVERFESIKDRAKGVFDDSVLEYLYSNGPSLERDLPNHPRKSLKYSYIGVLDIEDFRVSPVYYLYGEERTATRKFIDENRDIIDFYINVNPDKLKTDIDEVFLSILIEEWTWDNR